MPPRPAVHPSKKEAVFQLCNFLCTSSVEKLQDLADGKILLETIQTKFSLFSNDCPSTSSSEEIKASEVKVDFLHNKEESSDINSRNESEETEFNPAKEENDILLRYNNIQKFIDDHYEINSEIIISYDECRKSSELELIKVTIFVLSEIVKNLNAINNEHLQTLFHLDTKYQIELEDIFKVFITEREKLTKNGIETLLSKNAKNASPIVTPRRVSSRRTSLKEQKPVSPLACFSTPIEDVFTNSPLKAYFESPIFKKEDILKKNKEIQDMQKIMYVEDEEKERRISEMEKELEKKDKDYKQLVKQNSQLLRQKDEEIELLKNSYDDLSCKFQKLLIASDRHKKYDMQQIMRLEDQLVEAEKTLEEKETQVERSIIESFKSFSESPGNVSENPPNRIEELLRAEVSLLKDKIKYMELKIYSYKKQLSEKLLAELKQKKSPENLNLSYEVTWNELDHERKGEAETAARFIQEDNRILSARLNEATLIIRNLNNEIEALKEQLTRKNRKSNPQKKVSSVATDTEIKSVSELPDSSKIPETEILRKSLSHSKNVEHYFDQSGESYNIMDESDNSIPSPYPKKSSEAVLWQGFEKPETGSPCGINLSRDSLVPENSHLDVINDLGVNNIKIENVEPNSLLSQENKYVLGNLNFDAFLNELKKITKNGSFQKVLQVFGKQQSKINGRLDLQELLKMITECVCVAVSLNAESSFANLQDKCCSTDENELCSVNHNLEINKLNNELQATTQKYEIELKQYKMELEELKKAKTTMSYKCQAYEETIHQKSKAIEDLIRKFHEQKIKFENVGKKYIEHKDTISKLLVINKKERMARNTLKNKVLCMQEEKLHCDQLSNLLKEENHHLKQELQNLKVERNKLLREKVKRESIVSAHSRDAFPSRESYVGIPNHLSIKSELHSSTFQGTDNESVLSSAFHKSISHYVSENEDDFFDYNSLDSIKKEYEDDRVEELKRRNSLYPIHLQSSYPLEADLETTYASLYVKDGEKVKEEERCSKKRKVDGTVDEEPSTSSTFETPVSKPKKKMATPKSLQRFLRNIKHKKNLKMKPNGS